MKKYFRILIKDYKSERPELKKYYSKFSEAKRVAESILKEMDDTIIQTYFISNEEGWVVYSKSMVDGLPFYEII